MRPRPVVSCAALDFRMDPLTLSRHFENDGKTVIVQCPCQLQLTCAYIFYGHGLPESIHQRKMSCPLAKFLNESPSALNCVTNSSCCTCASVDRCMVAVCGHATWLQKQLLLFAYSIVDVGRSQGCCLRRKLSNPLILLVCDVGITQWIVSFRSGLQPWLVIWSLPCWVSIADIMYIWSKDFAFVSKIYRAFRVERVPTGN